MQYFSEQFIRYSDKPTQNEHCGGRYNKVEAYCACAVKKLLFAGEMAAWETEEWEG